jgi:hypothetical protein
MTPSFFSSVFLFSVEGGAMESRRIAVGALAAAAVLAFILSSSVFGCLPGEDSACAATRAPVRVTALNGAGGTTSRQLQVTIRTLKSDLLDFAGSAPANRMPAPKTEPPADAILGGPAGRVMPVKRPVAVVRLPSLRTLPDSDLAQLKTRLVAGDAPDNLVRARRLNALTVEITRREEILVTARVRRLNALALARTTTRNAALAAPVHVPAPVPPGSPDPYNAPAPSGTQVYISAHTSVWYSVSDRGRRLTMWLDANHQSGLTMHIYGPDQQDVWNSRPVGRAAPGEGHDFFWTGRSALKGLWRIRLTNTNDFAVPYTFTATAVSDKNGDLCRDCHGGSIEDEWERCEHEGSFCEDLKEEFAN